MHFVRSFQALSLLALLFLVGCGGPKQIPPVEREPEGSITQLRKDLEVTAKYGSGESALEPVSTGVANLDPNYPKAAELKAGYSKLGAASTDEERKKLAQDMINIIDSVSPPATPAP
jgi:hypothetical protein